MSGTQPFAAPVRSSRTATLTLLTAVLFGGWPSAEVLAHGAARAAEAGMRAIQFPDTAAHKVLVTDLHTHSVFSDGHVWPKIRVEEALRDGLDALAITEHLEYQPHRADIPHADRNRAIEAAVEAAAATDLIIVAGSEITREAPAGHINAVFISDANALLRVDNPPADAADVRGYYVAANAWPAQQAVDAAHAQQAFMFWNHPYWTAQSPDGIARINPFHAANARAGKLHGIEIANGQDYSEEAHAIALEHNLALIGVSDVHDLIDWDHPPHDGEHRPVTLVLAEERSPEALREALFARRTVVWFRNTLIGRDAELDALLAASLTLENARYLPETSLLSVTLANHSDAAFELRNTTDMTLMHSTDRLVVPAHTTTELRFKPGARYPEVELTFAVENALRAPGEHAQIRLTARVPEE